MKDLMSDSFKDIFDDPNIKVCLPKHNDTFSLNVSGMTFRQLAEHLRIYAELIEKGLEGCRELKTTSEFLFPNDDLFICTKHYWEDDYDDCNFISNHITSAWCENADGTASIMLTGTMLEVMQNIKDGETISEYFRREQ